LDNVTTDGALIGGRSGSGCEHVTQNPHNPQNQSANRVLRVVRVLSYEIEG
jgi:hypothetical protein